jgi:hypothetical protein
VRRYRRRGVLAATAAVGVSLAGCNFGDGGTDGGGPATGQSVESGPTPGTAATGTPADSLEGGIAALETATDDLWASLSAPVAAIASIDAGAPDPAAVDRVAERLAAADERADAAGRAAERLRALVAKTDGTPTNTEAVDAVLADYRAGSSAHRRVGTAAAAVWATGRSVYGLVAFERAWRTFSTAPVENRMGGFGDLFGETWRVEFTSLLQGGLPTVRAAGAELAEEGRAGGTPPDGQPDDLRIDWTGLTDTLAATGSTATGLADLVPAVIELGPVLSRLTLENELTETDLSPLPTFREVVSTVRARLGNLEPSIADAARTTDPRVAGDLLTVSAYPDALATLRTGLERYEADLARWLEEPDTRRGFGRPVLGRGNRVFLSSSFFETSPAGALLAAGELPRSPFVDVTTTDRVVTGIAESFTESIAARRESQGVPWDGGVADRRGEASVRLDATLAPGGDGFNRAVFEPPVVVVDPETTVTLTLPEPPRELFDAIATEFADGTGPARYVLAGERFEEFPLTVERSFEWPELAELTARAIWPEDIVEEEEMPLALARYPFAVVGVAVDSPFFDWSFDP